VISTALLGPVVALVAWSLIVLIYVAIARGAGIRKAGLQVDPSRGGRGQDLEGRIEPRYNWPAHNYPHLMEQPTLFYAIVLTLAVMGFDHHWNVWLAWAYVTIRVVHSIVQMFFNDLRVRFPLFLLSTLCLMGLTLHAALALLH
jgi:hypothetical protein